MTIHLTEQAESYLNSFERLAKQENKSLEDILELLAQTYAEMLREKLRTEQLSAQERGAIFDTLSTLYPTADELGIDEEESLAELNRERSDFNRDYFGTDFAEYVPGTV